MCESKNHSVFCQLSHSISSSATTPLETRDSSAEFMPKPNFPAAATSVIVTQSTFLLKYFAHAASDLRLGVSFSCVACFGKGSFPPELTPGSRAHSFFSSLFPLGGGSSRRKSPAAAAMSSLPAILNT
jgi:hypothetical protein